MGSGLRFEGRGGDWGRRELQSGGWGAALQGLAELRERVSVAEDALEPAEGAAEGWEFSGWGLLSVEVYAGLGAVGTEESLDAAL
jgi:hypothetical protein